MKMRVFAMLTLVATMLPSISYGQSQGRQYQSPAVRSAGPVRHPTQGVVQPARQPNMTTRRSTAPVPVAGFQSAKGQTIATVESKFASVVPVISVDTTTPSQVNVGRDAKFVVNVNNVGDATAEQLQLRATISRPVKLTEVTPRPSKVEGNVLVYDLGNFAPKVKKQLVIVFSPTTKGAIDLTTRTSYSCSTKSVVAVHQPRLQVVCNAPEEAPFGKPIELKVKITNTGDGIAENVVIRPNLTGAKAGDAKGVQPMEIGWLPPGQSQVIPLSVMATSAEAVRVDVVVSHAGGDNSNAIAHIHVNKPELQVVSNGPALSFVDREGVYEIRVRNTGNATAENVKVQDVLPAGMKLTVVGRPVQYDRNQRLLVWTLPSLNAGAEEILRFKAVTTTEGKQAQAITAIAEGGWKAEGSRITQVMSRANLNVAVRNIGGPVEINQPTEFSVLISNDGSKVADDVRVSVELADSLEPVVAEHYTASEGKLAFPGVRIGAGQQQAMQFKVIGNLEGEHVVRVTIESGERSQRLTTETTAFIYGDSNPLISSKPEAATVELPPVLGSPL